MGKDFSGQNLRGQSFKGQDLTGADFSYADIRSADFSNAILVGANFSHATAGLQRRWATCLLIGSLLLSALSGLILAFNGVWLVSFLFNKTIYYRLSGVIFLILFLIFFIVTVWKGLEAALGFVAVAVALTITSSFIWSLTFPEIGKYAVATTATVLLAIVVAVICIQTVTVAGAINIAGNLAGTGDVVASIIVALTVSIIADYSTLEVSVLLAVVGTFSMVLFVGLVSSYVAWRALAGDEKFPVTRSIAVAFAAIGGTSFRNADLTDTNFTKSTLKSTDLRGATLTRTCWLQAKKLSFARAGTTYLKQVKLQLLVVTGAGQNKNFDRLNLRGVNLQGANLADASFIGADLSESNLQQANLSRAKLVQTQLDRTNFTGACLTGAYIEDWGITAETTLERVKCNYVYMRLPTKDDPDPCRKPDNKQEIFEDGDFADFIAPIVKTLDLYHNQGVDPRAIAIAFKRLAENHPEADIEIVAMEKRGKDKFLLKAKTAEYVDRSYLAEEYFKDYNQFKFLPENHLELLLAAKDAHISSLQNMVTTALQRPSFYVEKYQNQGDTMPENQGSINISGVQGGSISNLAAVGQNMTGAAVGEISGTVTNTIGQLQDSDAPEAPKLADLLKQLQTVIEADTELNDEDKAEALEQVKALAEAGKNSKEGAMQKSAKTAMKILKGTITGLPSAAKLVEACNQLLPAIAQLLGLV
ncbi:MULTISPECIES: pentapeptide repeat-containing protein [Aerosakkonema]|uniref:pentapeptide repeat-containing protein n=1 Tax=Aerosakkonema TaxID=1246629 RepID=UPI0035B75870